MWTGLIWLRIDKQFGVFEHSNKHLAYVICGMFTSLGSDLWTTGLCQLLLVPLLVADMNRAVCLVR